MFEEIGDKRSEAIIYGNISNVYYDQSNYLKALEYNFKSLKIKEELGDKRGMAIILGNIGSLFINTKEYNKAEDYSKKALLIAESLQTLDLIRSNEIRLYELDSIKGNFQSALEHYKKYIAARDSIDNDDKRNQQLLSETKFEFEKRETLNKAEFEKQQALAKAELSRRQILLEKNRQEMLILEQENELKELTLIQSETQLKQKQSEAENQQKTIALLNKENEVKAAEAKQNEEALQKQKVIIYSISFGVLLVLALFAVAVYGYRQKQKANEIILQQKLIVEKQKHLV